jgi:hypothetical protein
VSFLAKEIDTELYKISRTVFSKFPYKQHHIPYIRPHTSDCAKLLLILQNDSVLFTEWKRNRSRRPIARTLGPETTTDLEDDGRAPSEEVRDRRVAENDTKIDFLHTPPNDPRQKEIQYPSNVDSIVTDQGRNGRSGAKVVLSWLDRNERRTTSSVPEHQVTQPCRIDDSERSKESKEEHEGSRGRLGQHGGQRRGAFESQQRQRPGEVCSPEVEAVSSRYCKAQKTKTEQQIPGRRVGQRWGQ